MAFGVVFVGYLLFPRLRNLDRLADAAPTELQQGDDLSGRA
jgi:hypothetical protein